jgi:hypothetical protein
VSTWIRLAEAAANIYDATDRTNYGGVEFRTEMIQDIPTFVICGTNHGTRPGWWRRMLGCCRDWLTNIQRQQIAIQIGGSRVKIHAGFWRAACEVDRYFEAWADDRDGKVALAGHSQGAAIAACLAILYEHRNPGKIAHLCLLACPKVGDAKLGQLFRALFQPFQYRLFARKLDPIVHLPTVGYKPLAKRTWLPSRLNGKLDHAAQEYVRELKDLEAAH